MRFEPLSQGETRSLLGSMAGNPKWDALGLASIESTIGNGHGYMAMDDSGPLVVVVVQVVAHAKGSELVVRVAHQVRAGRDLTSEVLPHIESVFGVGCDLVTIVTKRAGLVRKLERAGYGESAKIMRKKLK